MQHDLNFWGIQEEPDYIYKCDKNENMYNYVCSSCS